MDVTVGPVGPEELAERHVLGQQAFGHDRPLEADSPVPAAWHIAARHRGRIVAALTHLRLGQWWGGRAVPMGGIAGVNVAPEARGRGLARLLLREAFAEMRAEGVPVSALYPTTGTLYRSVGYGWAGEWTLTDVPLSILPQRGDPALTLEPVPPDPGPEARAVHDTVAAGRPGWLRRDDWAWSWLDLVHRRAGRPRFAYEARRDGRVVGFVSYRAAEAERAGFLVEVEELFAADGGAAASLLALLGGNTTMADDLRTRLPMSLLLPHLAHPQRTRRFRDWWWMLRLVDLPAAVAARGWPPDVDVRVPLSVVDPDHGHQEGPWVLVVAGGEGRLERGGAGTVSVHVADLAALYAGALDPATMAASGLLIGAGDAEVAALAAATAGPSPSLQDFF
jgi:predicted acetyltransferase